MVGADITNLVQHFYNTGSLEEKVTATNIVLVPKTHGPKLMKDLRPIALCNIAYKVVSKVISNRLKDVIVFVISETQSTFIPGRLI